MTGSNETGGSLATAKGQRRTGRINEKVKKKRLLRLRHPGDIRWPPGRTKVTTVIQCFVSDFLSREREPVFLLTLFWVCFVGCFFYFRAKVSPVYCDLQEPQYRDWTSVRPKLLTEEQTSNPNYGQADVLQPFPTLQRLSGDKFPQLNWSNWANLINRVVGEDI